MILKNKISLVTGGATGIGKATVETFAQQGATVIFCDVNKQKGLKTQKELKESGLKTYFFQADVSKEKEVKLCQLTYQQLFIYYQEFYLFLR